MHISGSLLTEKRTAPYFHHHDRRSPAADLPKNTYKMQHLKISNRILRTQNLKRFFPDNNSVLHSCCHAGRTSISIKRRTIAPKCQHTPPKRKTVLKEIFTVSRLLFFLALRPPAPDKITTTAHKIMRTKNNAEAQERVSMCSTLGGAFATRE